MRLLVDSGWNAYRSSPLAARDPESLVISASLIHRAMASAASFPSADIDETFFNDLDRERLGGESPPRSPPTISSMLNPDCPPRVKRMACILCRKRKLRCDGARPKCGTCGRLSHECGYDEVRKKSGPKRGYVKLLEARLRMFIA